MEFTGKVYFDDILQDNRDISNLLDNFKLAIKRETSFSSGDNILRESSDLAFDVNGCAYDYLCSKFKESPCDDVRVYFELNVHGEILSFNGLIRLIAITWQPVHRTANIKAIKDNSFSGYIRNFISTEVDLSNVKTQGCLDIKIDYLLLNTPTTPNIYRVANVKIYDVLSVFRYLVSYFTDNKITVVSDYLTNNNSLYAITTGYNMHNNNYNNAKAFPKVSISKLFNELRKKLVLYMAIEYDVNGSPYLRIEDESYFYTNDLLFTIDSIPLDAMQSMDKEKLYNEIKVGSTKVKLLGTALDTMPQKKLVGWNEEVKTSCGGCSGEKDTILDLVSSFVIDGNIIHESMHQLLNSDYENDNEIILLHYNYIGIPAVNIRLVGNNTSTYNISLNNENTLKRWVGISNSCIKTNNEDKYAFYLEEYLETGGLNNNAVIVHASNGFLCGSRKKNFITSTPLWYDNYPSLVTFYNGTPVGGCDEQLSVNPDAFKCNENGVYKFKSNIYTMQDGRYGYPPNYYSTQIPYDTTFELHILVYQDDTLSTLIGDYFDSKFIANPRIKATDLEVITPELNLIVGNIVFVYIRISTTTPTVNEDYTFEYNRISFESIPTSCTTITDNLDLFKPYVLEYSRFLSACDYNKIKANPKGYIDINGNKYYVGEVNYTLQKTDFKLITNKLIC